MGGTGLGKRLENTWCMCGAGLPFTVKTVYLHSAPNSSALELPYDTDTTNFITRQWITLDPLDQNLTILLDNSNRGMWSQQLTMWLLKTDIKFVA